MRGLRVPTVCRERPAPLVLRGLLVRKALLVLLVMAVLVSPDPLALLVLPALLVLTEHPARTVRTVLTGAESQTPNASTPGAGLSRTRTAPCKTAAYAEPTQHHR